MKNLNFIYSTFAYYNKKIKDIQWIRIAIIHTQKKKNFTQEFKHKILAKRHPSNHTKQKIEKKKNGNTKRKHENIHSTLEAKQKGIESQTKNMSICSSSHCLYIS